MAVRPQQTDPKMRDRSQSYRWQLTQHLFLLLLHLRQRGVWFIPSSTWVAGTHNPRTRYQGEQNEVLVHVNKFLFQLPTTTTRTLQFAMHKHKISILLLYLMTRSNFLVLFIRLRIGRSNRVFTAKLVYRKIYTMNCRHLKNTPEVWSYYKIHSDLQNALPAVSLYRLVLIGP